MYLLILPDNFASAYCDKWHPMTLHAFENIEIHSLGLKTNIINIHLKFIFTYYLLLILFIFIHFNKALVDNSTSLYW